LENEVLDIVDARCNHEVQILYYLVPCINTLYRSTYIIKHTMYLIISDIDFHFIKLVSPVMILN